VDDTLMCIHIACAVGWVERQRNPSPDTRGWVSLSLNPPYKSLTLPVRLSSPLT